MVLVASGTPRGCHGVFGPHQGDWDHQGIMGAGRECKYSGASIGIGGIRDS